MCGIFGLVAKKAETDNYTPIFIPKTLKNLARLSEARGKDSSGICFKSENKGEFQVLKSNQRITGLMKSQEFKGLLKNHFEDFQTDKDSVFASFGHSRLVTNGTQLESTNNQPVHRDGIIGIHNGIVVNVDKLWDKYDLRRRYEIDTEVMLALVNHYYEKDKDSILSVKKAMKEIEGTVSTCLFFEKLNQFILFTNNGSLYYATNYKDVLIFGSERYIIEEAVRKSNLENYADDLQILQVRSNEGVLFNLDTFTMIDFNLDDNADKKQDYDANNIDYSTHIADIKIKNDRSTIFDIDNLSMSSDYLEKKKLLEYNLDKIDELKRCSCCILPETFPYISFDEKGVCNYCNNYVKRNQPKSLDELKKLVEPYKSRDGSLDCLVPFSGGRDSTYVLHFVKKELGLNPLAYTYDWGMVTDLARRNIARVCGKLGVENVIVAADIKKKRENIKLNIEAWLKKPDLGMIPLFMAGDKQFFKHANIVKDKAKIKLNIWGINFLENTDFKVGFCGVPPDWDKEMIYSMSFIRQMKLFSHVSKNLMKNPSYFNSSIPDTFDSFLSRYLNPRKDYYHFFDFYNWDEEEIEDILLNDYDWETSKDLKSTWRIGDGTASFYNYIYYTVAGFSEFDTFRSNQIREGMISREEALELVNDENIPRYDSLRWYMEIIGLDFECTIKIVNQIPKLY